MKEAVKLTNFVFFFLCRAVSSQSQERAETGSLSVVDRHVLPSHNAVQLCRQENTDLELVADPFGYGFSIAGGGLNGPITVSSIEKDSPADRSEPALVH